MVNKELLDEKFKNIDEKLDKSNELSEKILEAIHGKDGLATKTTKNATHLYYLKWIVGILFVAFLGGKII